MHGKRVATNGDLRLEQTPGQWQPLPVQAERKMLLEDNTIETMLHYPDMKNHLRGFNPMIYPDFDLGYKVLVKGEKDFIRLSVHLDRPISKELEGKICFNLELFPGELFGQPWIMDNYQGIFPRQPNGPVMAMPSNIERSKKRMAEGAIIADRDCLAGNYQGYQPMIADDWIAVPYAVGKRFMVRPDEPLYRLTIESHEQALKLYDGRMNHNNGWFVISSEIPAGKAEHALEWMITPNIVDAWRYPPVIQVSQIGYMPNQPKQAIIELDLRTEEVQCASLYRIDENGRKLIKRKIPDRWGEFLRYQYLQFDFSEIEESGLFQIEYNDSLSTIFQISADVYDRGVWQPVLEYFLPVQMCHMRVNEKYRVWHDLCHHDDARMAPVQFNHFDGYIQGSSTLTHYQSGECVPGLNIGGWHDAGDYDLRIESQASEIYRLALVYQEFGLDYDATTIDQKKRIVEIHQPDGENDLLQQIEHGTLSIIAGYNALGRLYRGIICNNLRQYVLLGEASAMTDGVPGNWDDRWVFTEDNPYRELTTTAHLAAASKALKNFRPELSCRMLEIARELYQKTKAEKPAEKLARIHAAIELMIATDESRYRNDFVISLPMGMENIHQMGWLLARAARYLSDREIYDKMKPAMQALQDAIYRQSKETPYGIPYRPHIWGAGWDIQRRGFEYYFLNRAYPDIFPPEMMYHSLNFILGCHPGSNTASFASGIGAHSATTAYGANRADFSYIPGGVISGTALIRPDFPELLEWPFLWQQGEYVIGGGSTNYLFLVLAVRQILKEHLMNNEEDENHGCI